MYTQLTIIENMAIDDAIKEFYLHKGSDLIEYLPKEFYQRYGENIRGQLSVKCVDFKNLTKDNIVEGITSGEDFNEHYHNILGAFFGFPLWLVRDVCVYSHRAFLFNVEQNQFFENIRNSYITRADGKHHIEKIELSDLKNAVTLTNNLSKVVGTQQKRSVEKGINSYGYSNNTVDYSLTNRFERCRNFIINARCTNDVLEKISWYIVALESLFSDINRYRELKQTLAKRVPPFISSDNNEMLRLKKDILDGYSIRSSYLHGSRTKANKSDHILHVTISTSLDDILRRSFLTAINDPDKKSVFADPQKFKEIFKLKALK